MGTIKMNFILRNKLCLLFSIPILYSAGVFGQTDTSLHYFKKIGWTIKYPEGFHYVVESGLNDTSAAVIYSLNDYKEIHKHFFVLAKGRNAFAMNFYNFSDRKITTKNLDSVNNWNIQYFFQALIGKVTALDSTKSTDDI
jgi:hypothetical protein